MAIKFPDILEHNNPALPLVDITSLKGVAYPLDDINDTGSIPGSKRKIGTIVFATGSSKYYGYLGSATASVNWEDPANWSELGTGGGSGGSGIFTSTSEYGGVVFGTTSSIQVTASAYQSSSYVGTGVTANPNNAGSDGSILKYGAMFSQSIWHYTDNIGYPTTTPWKTDLDGSVFDRYTANTDTAEIVRFMAGLLSASAPDVAPNTNTWNSTEIDFSVGGTTNKSSYMTGVLGSITYLNAKLSKDYNSSTRIDLTKTESYRRVQEYLIGKGFVDSAETGSDPLHDVGTNPLGKNFQNNTYGDHMPSTIYNSYGTFNYNADSKANVPVPQPNTSSISQSPNKTFSFGNLSNPTTVVGYEMSVIATQSFSNQTGSGGSVPTPDENSTFSTSSDSTYTISTEQLTGNADGLFLGIIPSSNASIDAQYQDGKFLNSPGTLSGRIWSTTDADKTTGATTASIGFYRLHGLAVGLKTGSQAAFGYNTVDSPNTTQGFYAPTLATLGVLSITQNDPSITMNQNAFRTSFTATSRSLSGAPYLLTTTYGFDFSADGANCFDPCYAYSTTPLQTSLTSNGWSSVGSLNISNTSISVTSAGIQTSTVNGGVYPNGGNPSTRRALSSTPVYNDVAFISSSATFTLSSNSTNTVQSQATMFSRQYTFKFRSTGRNWKGSINNTDTSNINFYDSILFDQDSTSGSLAVYSRAQGYDAGSQTGTTSFSEGFSGEDYRIRFTAASMVGTYAGADLFTSSTFTTIDENNSDMTINDLQVKPGFLVQTGGSNGYWIKQTPTFNPATFQFYGRIFTRAVGTGAVSMTLNVGKTLVEWNDVSTPGVSAAILFQSSGTGVYATPRIYDPAPLTSNQIATNIANGTKNPFPSAIDLYGNTGGGVSGTNYTIPLRGADGMVLDGTSQGFIVIIRYKNDPTPITSISVTIA